MLEQLIVRDFALAARCQADWHQGMTAITGETGAGKSLVIDALGAVTGERTRPEMVRPGAQRAEIEAVFSLKNLDKVRQQIKNLDLAGDDDNSLILRRSIGSDGKSRAYVNSHPCTLTVLRELGQELLAVHGQHAGVRLMDGDRQRQLLDVYGALDARVQAVSAAYEAYSRKRSELTALGQEQQQGAQEYRNLRQDAEELRQLGLSEGTYEDLSLKHDRLAHAAKIAEAVALAQAALSSDEQNVISVLDQRIRDLEHVRSYSEEELGPIIDDLCGACELLDRARNALDSASDSEDPEQMNLVAGQLGAIHDLARKLKVQPQELYRKTEEVESRLKHFLGLKDQIAAVTAEVRQLRDVYEKEAAALSEARVKAAENLSEEVSREVRQLEMPDAVFRAEVSFESSGRPRPEGRDNVRFMFSANAGMEPLELGAVASGGELSRLALVIEMLTSEARDRQTLIFDEVDTGISGRTASAVGALLHTLGRSVQVITVTHLPQVAARADCQFLVSKQSTSEGVISTLKVLSGADRVEEIARMMGGQVVTEATRAGARALLEAGDEI